MVGIVILNYMTWQETISCVNSVIRSCTIPKRIFIVDNGSTNESCLMLKKLSEGHHDIEFVRLMQNKGYAVGNNYGIKCAIDQGIEIIVISNNDVVFEEKSIEIMEHYLQEHDDVGIVSPAIKNTSGKIINSRYGRLGVRETYLVTTPIRFIDLTFAWRGYFYRDVPSGQAQQVFAVSGCCFMIRGSIIGQIGFFDENTFLFEEEAIIGMRIEKAGYKTVYLPAARVVHAHAITTKLYDAMSFTHFVRSEMYYCAVYLKLSLLGYYPLIIIRFMQYFVRCLTKRSYRSNLRFHLYSVIGRLKLYEQSRANILVSKRGI